MARGKKVKTGGKSRGTPRKTSKQSKSFIRSSNDFDSDADLDFKPFTLKDTARNSEHPRSYWASSSTTLRHQSMNFVRSSEVKVDQEEKEETHESSVQAQGENVRPAQGQKSKATSSDSDPSATYPTPQGTDSADDSIVKDVPISQDPFKYLVPTFEPAQRTRLEKAVPGPLSRVYQDHEILGLRSTKVQPKSTPSSHPAYLQSPPSSSDEEVTFIGRKQPQVNTAPSPVPTHNIARQTSQRKTASRSKSISQQKEASSKDTTPQIITPAPQDRNTTDHSHEFMTLTSRPKGSPEPLSVVQPQPRHESRPDKRSNKRKRPRRRGPESSGHDAATQAALEDYLANMQDNNEFAGLDADADAAEMDTDMNGWATEDIEDFGDMSTSEEILETVSHVLSKRTRESGLQYLVVWEEHTVDEARWIQHQSLPASADLLIKAFEEEEKNIREATAEEDDDDSDSEDENSEASFALDWGSDESIDENEILGDDDDDFGDDQDLIQRRMERMTDEHIARLYAKQQALGIMDDELVIFDGIEDMDISDSILTAKAPNASRKRSLKRSKANAKQPKPTFFDPEDALKFEGDDYGLFDPMDRDRPGLVTGKAKGKGKQPPAFDIELSDSSLADTIRNTWENDRRAKKAKKAEREELRAQGLLGRKNNKSRPDLKARYTDGMSVQALEAEFEAFLFQDQQQMSLPPMDKRDRKIIHDICGQFGLKSKSQGAGKKRFPVIFKTRRTSEFSEQVFAKLKQTLNRRFFTRMDTKGKSRVAPNIRNGASGGGFGGKNALGYREGEIVGAGASEIGQENRGRAMLEKMGWSKGTSLGVLGSNGILTPIEHIVKNSKAGLG